jgi:FkbM family methyltransferase
MTMLSVNPQSAPPPGTLPRVGLFVARHRRNRVVRKFAGLCRRFLSWYANVSYDLDHNGEGFVLDTLAGFKPMVILDVGANVGDWSLAAAQRCASAQIHAFEISPLTFEQLASATKSIGRIHPESIGLSDKEGSIRIRHYDGLPALTTATEYPHPFPFTEISAEVTIGDRYTASRGIGHIDLLKLDVEGMEHRVLKGFSGMLERKAIDLVQFEYGRVSIVHGFLLRDFYAFFRERGYVVGKIYPNYIDFRDYDMSDEDFLGPNYLACRADKADYIDALKRSA